MNEYTFRVRTLTPMFVGGADNTLVDLGPPSLRGPMRFWFRAMMGYALGDNLKALHELEAAAFGATDSASPFIMRIHLGNLQKIQVGAQRRLQPGYAYLAFSMHEWAGNGQHKQTRECIKAEQDFTVTFRFRRHDPLLEQMVLGSFWLLAHFGGIGSRSRRGFGAFTVVTPGQASGFNMIPGVPIRNHYIKNFNVLLPAFQAFAARETGSTEKQAWAQDRLFTTFALRQVGLLTLQEWKSGEDVLNTLGAMLRGLRNGMLKEVAPHEMNPQDWRERTYDYQDVIGPLMDRRVLERPALTNDALGLPYMIRSTSRKRLASIQGRSNQGTVFERRSSPLFLRPVALPENRFGAVIAVFPAAILPPDAVEQVKIERGDTVGIQKVTEQQTINLGNWLFERLEKWYAGSFTWMMTPKKEGA